MINSGMVGVPMVGADICGFAENTTEELCQRWIQLGAFYPFSRSHSMNVAIPQEVYIWETVAASARTSLGLRYRLLPYFYSLMFEAHNKGSPIARALFFAFPEDSNTLTVSNQFLLGTGVMVSPVVTPRTTSVRAYFPRGTWYNMFDYTSKVESSGEHVTLNAPADAINVHVHEGSIIPMQEGGLTTSAAKKTPFTLVVAFSASKQAGFARGKLFLDNGEDFEMEIRKGRSTFVRFFGQQSLEKGVLSTKVVSGDYAVKEGWAVQTVVILGANSAPTDIKINGESVFCTVKSTFDAKVPSLTISGLALPVGEEFELQWSTQGHTSF